MSLKIVWLSVGFLGQACFFMRFLVQWIVSEKKEESFIPVVFWYFSLGGAMLLLSYAIWRKDPVFIIGQSFGFVVYIRNLILINRKKNTIKSVSE
ncbi:MAG: lipid-A-disaccharide synthase N-terminal domain-containing protein [Elusimicrobia bacterium]|nr:lipid-A-disaccharide synthase N-terminal domain-containing protein [Elusimicrobiota bacterium]